MSRVLSALALVALGAVASAATALPPVDVTRSALSADPDRWDIKGCTYSSTSLGTDFDFSQLIHASWQSYIVRDPFESASRWLYQFNICNFADQPHGLVCEDKQAGAFRLSEDETECHTLGHLTDASEPAKMALVSTSNPAAGVDLVYPRGSTCKKAEKYSFTVRLVCASPADAGITQVDEITECKYRAEFKHPAACPKQCPAGDRGVCGGNGLCGFDTDAAATRCFCNVGYYGPSCLSRTDEDSSAECDGTCAALVVVFCFLSLVFIGVLGLLWRVHRMARMPVQFESGFTDPSEYARAREEGALPVAAAARGPGSVNGAGRVAFRSDEYEGSRLR